MIDLPFKVFCFNSNTDECLNAECGTFGLALKSVADSATEWDKVTITDTRLPREKRKQL